MQSSEVDDATREKWATNNSALQAADNAAQNGRLLEAITHLHSINADQRTVKRHMGIAVHTGMARARQERLARQTQ